MTPYPQSGGRFFPHVVARIAGMPAEGLENLAAVQAMGSYRAWQELDAELDQIREPLTEALFEAIGGLDHKATRTSLLRLKRDVHNLRPLNGPRLDQVHEAASQHLVANTLVQNLDRYADLVHRRGQARSHFESVFEDDLAHIRRTFQATIQTESFRNGLLLASTTLFDEVGRYLRASAQKPGAKVRQVERSLLRYYTRAAAKTTPFSTFCTLAPGSLRAADTRATDAPIAPVALSGNPLQTHTLIRLNRMIYSQLVASLTTRPVIQHHLDVELSSTLHEEDGQWRFLADIDDREVFQHLAPNPVISLVHQILCQHHSLRQATLIELLLESVDASEDELAAYVGRLLEVGFLRFRLGIREQDTQWDQRLRAFLDGIDDDHARKTVHFLSELRRQADSYAKAPLERRRHLLKSLSRFVDAHFASLGDTRWTPGTGVLYEDAGAAANLTVDLGDLGDLLKEYVKLTHRFIWILGEQVNMRHFFTSCYGTRPVSLLCFFEDYYREHLESYLASVRAAEEAGDRMRRAELNNPFRLELVGRLDAARHAFEERILELWRADPSAEEIILERQDLENAASGLPDFEEPCRSISLFAQYVPRDPGEDREKGDALVVGKGYLAGFGKYFSRFLDALPGEVQRDLTESSHDLVDGELAEICGDTEFNADLHPPILPHEIAYPNVEGGIAEDQISVADLVVEPDPDRSYRLRLVNSATGREVIPVDLGFRSPRLRPPLFQLLSRMMPASAFLLSLPEERSKEPRSGVLRRPRVTYRGRLVLARQRWTIPQELFPSRRPGERDAEHFLRIQRWREDLDLPAEAFVRIRQPGRPDPQLTGKAAGVREHLDKPQYIDFRSPLLVDLLCRMPEKLDRFELLLEECLPSRDQSPSNGGAHFATELVLQLDFPASSAHPSTLTPSTRDTSAMPRAGQKGTDDGST